MKKSEMAMIAAQDYPVCPYCGHVERDAWEIDFGAGLDGDTDICCNRCGSEYFCSRQVSVKYRSSATVARKEDQ